VRKILDERDGCNERYQANNVEPPPPHARETFAEAVERAPDRKSGIDATSGVQHSTDGPPRATMTATQQVRVAQGHRVELRTLLMIPLGRANANQIKDVNAEGRTAAATLVTEMMITVDENRNIKIERTTMNAGAAIDHRVVVVAAVDLQEDQRQWWRLRSSKL
jgi:hypothetical protein